MAGANAPPTEQVICKSIKVRVFQRACQVPWAYSIIRRGGDQGKEGANDSRLAGTEKCQGSYVVPRAIQLLSTIYKGLFGNISTDNKLAEERSRIQMEYRDK